MNENNSNNPNSQEPENNGGFFSNLPWKTIGIATAVTTVVGVGAYFAYNGLMGRVVEVATDTAQGVIDRAAQAVDTVVEIAG